MLPSRRRCEQGRVTQRPTGGLVHWWRESSDALARTGSHRRDEGRGGRASGALTASSVCVCRCGGGCVGDGRRVISSPTRRLRLSSASLRTKSRPKEKVPTPEEGEPPIGDTRRTEQDASHSASPPSRLSLAGVAVRLTRWLRFSLLCARSKSQPRASSVS